MAKNRKNIVIKNSKSKEHSVQLFAPIYKNVFLFGFCIVYTFSIYFYSTLHNQFTNWDDSVNVTANTDIRTFHGQGIGKSLPTWFTISREDGMYSPLTRLSFFVQYEESELNPVAYHLANLALHLLNTALVFGFVVLLTNQRWVAFITALLFGIHPMHVESVAWVTGRIDVLYTLFYMAGLCMYVLYAKSSRWHFYILSFIAFLLALLSKASAVTLPVVFFAIDYFLQRKVTYKTVLEKLPFLVLSLAFGLLAVYAQKALVLEAVNIHYSLIDKILFICYALLMYVCRFFVPVNLSCFYKYPLKLQSHTFFDLFLYPPVYYIAPVALVIVALLINKKKRPGKDMLFGLSFFFINIALLLPGFASRKTIIADRYTYVSYIGLFFISAFLLNNLWGIKSAKFQFSKRISQVVLIMYLLWCGYLTFERSNVWQDSITLWTDAIRVDADCSVAYNNRGLAYADSGELLPAIDDYTRAISLDHHYSEAYNNLGVAYINEGRSDLAVDNYKTLVRLNPKFAQAYNNQGNAYLNINQRDLAIADYSKAISLNPNYAIAYKNRGGAYLNKSILDSAISDYSAAIRLNPKYVEVYYNRGLAYARQGKFDQTIADCTMAIKLNPQYAEAFNNRGTAYWSVGKLDLALNDYTSAIARNQQFADAYFNRGVIEQKSNPAQAELDIQKAKEIRSSMR
jgi:tetratricopeptide (TPR) repeat protein